MDHTINIKQLEGHIMHIKFDDGRKVTSVSSTFERNSGKYTVVFVVLSPNGDELQVTLPVFTFGLFTPEEISSEQHFANEMARFVDGHSMIWGRIK